MNAAVYVEQAKEMASKLEDMEAYRRGSRPLARKSVSSLSDIPESFLYSLRYRPPKSIPADIFNKLCLAIEQQAEKHIEGCENDIWTARARRLGLDDNIIREAEASVSYAKELLKKGSEQ